MDSKVWADPDVVQLFVKPGSPHATQEVEAQPGQPVNSLHMAERPRAAGTVGKIYYTFSCDGLKSSLELEVRSQSTDLDTKIHGFF